MEAGHHVVTQSHVLHITYYQTHIIRIYENLSIASDQNLPQIDSRKIKENLSTRTYNRKALMSPDGGTWVTSPGFGLILRSAFLLW